MRTRWRRLIAAAALTAAACTPGAQPAQTPASAPAPTPAVSLRPSEPFGLTTARLEPPDGGSAVALPVYDAYTSEARARGLMHRRQLPRRAGMVFRFSGPTQGGFYMKNTLIPLSIAFFDRDGDVVDVLDMPPCKSDPCPTYVPRAAYTGALEVNRGFFDSVGLKPGWRIRLPDGLPRPE